MTTKTRVNRSAMKKSIQNIKTTVQSSASIPQEKKVQLLYFLSVLESEIGELYKSEPAQARSITGFIESSAAEAMRRNKNMKQLKLSLEGVAASVKEFEISHPRLMAEVNCISTMLANMGV